MEIKFPDYEINISFRYSTFPTSVIKDNHSKKSAYVGRMVDLYARHV
jgi:hypothetical protein